MFYSSDFLVKGRFGLGQGEVFGCLGVFRLCFQIDQGIRMKSEKLPNQF